MNWSGRSAIVYDATNWVARTVLLQVLWMALCLAGGVVLGVFPACFVLLIAAKRELQGRRLDIGRTWQAFRAHFWRANAFGYATTLLIGCGFAQVFLLPPAEGAFGLAVSLVVPITTFWLSYWTVNAWVRLAMAESLSLDDVTATLPIILLYPLRSMITLLAVALVLVILFRLPALAVVAGASGLAMVMMRLGRWTDRPVVVGKGDV